MQVLKAMFTRKALAEHIDRFINELELCGYLPERVLLFGSYAAGSPHEYSDIDLAVWDQKFTGCGSVDVEPIARIVSKYHPIELHTFDPADDQDTPFIREIKRKGIVVLDRMSSVR